MADEALPRLVTIPISHYCEKARWALNRAAVEYVEDAHLQVLHRRPVRRAGGGKTVPVLRLADRTLSQSTDIVRWALPELFDGGLDPTLRERLSRDVEAFDAFGVHSRRWIYDRVLPARAVVAKYNATGVPDWERRMMPWLMPVIAAFLRRYLKITPASISESRSAIARTLDDVAERLRDGRPYLFGEAFTAADLTFAALGAPLVLPPEYGVPLPDPDELPAATAIELRTFRRHEAGQYIMKLYREQRRASPLET